MNDYKQQALLAIEALRERIRELEQSKPALEPIAIIGYAARFPGAPNAEAYWKLLKEGRDTISEIPADRWDVDAFYDPDPDMPGKMVTRRAGFIEDVPGFDAAFFGISPREATFMDPQHRIMLETAWLALEHAGLPPADQGGTRTGVFMGLNTHEYLGLLIANMTYESIDIYSATGTSPAAGVGRISYRLGLEGPAVIIDTACSSSLVAIHQASQALRSGECDTALAGGVNIILNPTPMINFSRVRMLSPDGRCKTFDAAADGYVRGEGCGIVVLKRLSDAVRDGDHIRAIIRGSAVNQDGASGGLTVPNGRAQQRVITDALKQAGVEPREVDYLEAHGTGTSLGDPIEVQAAAAALGIDRDRPLQIGSVKTNIGHLEAASGIAGIIKVVMSLEHELLPKHLHFQNPSPHIPWARIPVEVVQEATPWPRGERRRIAGVSSFGFSGTNAHVVVEEAPALAAEVNAPASSAGPEARRYGVLPLSARTPEALKELASQYVSWLDAHPEASLADLCYTAGAGRSHLEQRAALVMDSRGRARRLIEALVEDQPSPGVFSGGAGDPPKTAWLFTGQGSQYAGMAKELYETQPVFREVLDHCQEVLRSEMELPLLDVIFGDQPGISHTSYAQPALFAVEMALARLWQHWGLEPDVVLGHSVGQYSAACVAGVFSLDDGLKLLAKRGKLMGALSEGGSMAAVFTDATAVEAQLNDYPRLSIAAYNGANTVVSGPEEDVKSLMDSFQVHDVRCEALDTSHAFHSALLEPMLNEFEQYASTFEFKPLQRALVCNRTGKLLNSQSQLDAQYWRRHARQPVQFAESVQTLSELGCRVLLEVGPQPVLTAMAMRVWPDGPVTPKAIASMRKDQPDGRQIMEALAQLYVSGARPRFAAVDGHLRHHKLDVPTYPFQHRPYWFTPTRIDAHAMRSAPAEMARMMTQTFEEPAEPEPSFAADADAWLLAVDPEEREERLAEFLRAELARAMGVDVSDVDPDAFFITLGMDSLMAIELRSRLQAALGMQIPASALIYNYPTLTSLTTGLLDMWTDLRHAPHAVSSTNGANHHAPEGELSTPWLIAPKDKTPSDVRLITFSYAGGGASAFHPWRTTLGSRIGLYAVQLPGHENRYGEPFIQSLSEMNELLDLASPWLSERPFVLFGHSMGAVVAFEVARELRRKGGPQPAALVVSAAGAPHLPARVPPLARLSLSEAIEKMTGYFPDIPEAVLNERELLETAAKILQADMAIVESYELLPEPPLEIPIYAFGGAEDPWVNLGELEAWREHTTADFSAAQLAGGHFYFKSPESQKTLLDRLADLCLRPAVQVS